MKIVLALLFMAAACMTSMYSVQHQSKSMQHNSSSQIENDDLIYLIANKRVHIVYDDITSISVDVIVNAANQMLMKNPGGVAGYIWKAAGANKLNQYIDLHITRPLPVGSAVETPAFNLRHHGVQYIIHTPGPNCAADDDIHKLYDSYRNSIFLADTLQCTSIAFPAISIGIFCCDIKTCAELAIKAIRDIAPNTLLSDIYLIINKNPNDVSAQIYRKELIALLSIE